MCIQVMAELMAMKKNNHALHKFADLLRQKKLRATPIRLSILEQLARSEQPLSIEELFAILGRTGRRNELDLATLYRNIKSFEEAGLVASIDLGTGRSFYEFKTGESHHHHHVICEGCQKIEHLEVCGIEPHIKMLEKMGYRRLRHKLEFSGLCRACG
jgi:Fe2+ or Zn2+ uptake regulation protein